MQEVICPNCCTVVPPLPHCLTCNVPLSSCWEGGDEEALSSTESCNPGSIGLRVKRSANIGSELFSDPAIQMDSQLHKTLNRVAGSVGQLATSSTAAGEIAVIALVDSVDDLKSLDGFRIISVTPPVNDRETLSIVTARIPALKIEDFRSRVRSLKQSRPVRPSLERTVQEIGARHLNNAGAVEQIGNGGEGVIVGIVDFGMDFMHKNFRNEDGTTRVLAIWDQKMPQNADSPKGFPYGTLYTEDKINEALKDAEPYKKLGYGPPPDNLTQIGAHGTYVADVAAGNGNGTGAGGVAPKAHIVFVDASSVAIPNPGSHVIGSNLGDSTQVAEAVKFIFEFAAERGLPCVINLSLATGGGPHDGTSAVELQLDRLVQEAPDRAVVVCAANLSGKSVHAIGQVTADKPVDIKWQAFPNDSTSNELEIWYSKDDRFEVEVITPAGKSKTIEFGEKVTVEVKNPPVGAGEPGAGEMVTMVVVNRKSDSINGDNTINIFFEHEVGPGIWTIRLKGVEIGNGAFHAWIERDENGQSRFIDSDSCKINDSFTLGSLAGGSHTITVGAYDAHEDALPLSEFSSFGPTRDGRKKPELSAPGEEVLAAYSGTLVRRNVLSGTSMAAPAVAGVVALMMATARENNEPLTTSRIREILISTARKNPPNSGVDNEGWHPQYGFGRVSAEAAVAAVLKPLSNVRAATTETGD